MRTRKTKKQRRPDRFPAIIYHPDPAIPPGITKIIKDASAKIDLKVLPFYYRDLLYTMRAAPHAARKLAATDNGRLAIEDISTAIGDQLYHHIGESRIEQWVPYYIPLVIAGPTIYITVDRLLSCKGPMGTGYYIDGQKVKVNGKTYIHGWSRHALERLCLRSVPDWPCYLAVGCIVSLMASGRYEHVMLSDGTPALTAFFPVLRHSWHDEYAKIILRTKRLDRSLDYFYRFGYFPYTTEGDMLKCLTMLPPGFRGTPEHTALRNCKKLPWEHRLQLLKMAETMTAKEFYEKGNEDGQIADLFTLFDRIGAPQIISRPTKRDVAANNRRKIMTSGFGMSRGTIHIEFIKPD